MSEIHISKIKPGEGKLETVDVIAKALEIDKEHDELHDGISKIDKKPGEGDIETVDVIKEALSYEIQDKMDELYMQYIKEAEKEAKKEDVKDKKKKNKSFFKIIKEKLNLKKYREK